jgi:hypothetical protein
VFLLLIASLAACGSGNSDSSGGRIRTSATSASDREIASRLRAYIERGCTGPTTAAPKPGSKGARYLARRFGGVEAYIERVRRTCESYQEIVVRDGVISVRTTLTSSNAEDAARVCDTVQASDVADFTPGSVVLGQEEEVLARCPARQPR